VAVLSSIALALVLAGVYSVIAQSVVQRQRELAIRTALGAEPWRVIAHAMRTAMLPVAIGVGGGMLGGLVLTRLMGSVLYGVTSSDLATWLIACSIVPTACVAAGYLPARRAARIDPMTALRAE
jgi:ABC-type antimicrobial peptide transport system permease subunit